MLSEPTFSVMFTWRENTDFEMFRDLRCSESTTGVVEIGTGDRQELTLIFMCFS